MRFLERTPVRVAAFAVALATVFALALGIGSQVGPIKEPAVADSDSHGAEEGHGMEGAEHTADLPGGVMVSQDGYTLRLAQAQISAGRSRRTRSSTRSTCT